MNVREYNEYLKTLDEPPECAEWRRCAETRVRRARFVGLLLFVVALSLAIPLSCAAGAFKWRVNQQIWEGIQ